ncbi:MAG TPA: amidohydrolase family protein [Devosia sp.]|uniref:amidohydrolase family protein n=1 Tax=Devosia sp. TaxID=1871048 RepID=UPI002DDD60B1|nr:amidohydrolase family protein [Devosia sp.]HEV2515719.1 amidohydrolase family protein [Devosia sp.]
MNPSEAPLCLPPRPLAPIPRPLPDGTVDTHFHVFEQGAPLATPRSYTPEVRTLADWQAYASAANIARGILVQPSVYGFDNSVLLAALAGDPARLRGIVVLHPETDRAEFRRLDALGVRGVRINTRNKGGLPFSAIAALSARIADLGWMLQFQVRPAQLEEIGALLPALACKVVLDHLGFVDLDAADAEAQLSKIQRLLDSPFCYTKLSAPYRLTRAATYAPFGAAARQLLASHPERLLWGSDWPHTELFDQMADDAELIELTHGWLADPGVARQVLVTNAEALFFAGDD